jgi:hypothetical protein
LLHVDALSNWHVPLVAPIGTMQRSEVAQGAVPGVHVAMSPSAATQSPGILGTVVHVAPAWHSTPEPLTMPHGAPDSAKVIGTHVLEVKLHERPCVGSQPGPVLRLGSHVEPIDDTPAWHVPGVAGFVFVLGVEPTHQKPTPQGVPSVQLAPESPGVWHVAPNAAHSSPAPQFVSMAHEAPAAGGD